MVDMGYGAIGLCAQNKGNHLLREQGVLTTGSFSLYGLKSMNMNWISTMVLDSKTIQWRRMNGIKA